MSGGRRGVRVFSALVRLLLPRDLRERAEAGIVEVFAARLTEARTSGAVAVLRAWTREVCGLLVVGVRSRRRDAWSERADAALQGRPRGERRGGAVNPTGVDVLVQDIRFAVRSARRRPAPYVLAVVTCALGVGTSVAMFGVVDGVLWKSLPYPEPDRIVSVYPTIPSWREHPLFNANWQRGSWSYPEYADWAVQQRSYEQAAVFGRGVYTLTGQGEPERLEIGRSSAQLFAMLGATPIVGRTYTDAEGSSEADRVLVVTWGFWQERLGGSQDVLGQTMTLNDQPFTIIGVLPASFRVVSVGFTNGEPRAWAPIRGSELTNRDDHNLRMIARLATGVSLEGATAETSSILGRISAGHSIEHGAHVVPRLDDETRNVRGPLVILLAASVLLLVVACVNVAALVLGLGIDRSQELVVRGAIGASRPRLIRQLVTESLGLGLVAGALGVILALVVTKALIVLAPPGVPRIDNVTLDLRAFMFAALATTFVSVFFGLVPALTLTGDDLSKRLRGARVAASGQRIHAGLVVAQLALATVLVIGASLLTRTLLKLDAVDPGFDPRGVLTVRISPSIRSFSPDGAFSAGLQDAYYARARDALASTPGVEQVALTSTLPFSGDRGNNAIEPEGYVPAPGELVTAERNWVTANYMDAMRMSVREGRAFLDADERTRAPVAIVTSSFARRWWPGGSAVGRRFTFFAGTFTIVGVIDDVRDRSLAIADEPRFYIPHPSGSGGSFVLRIRTGVGIASVVPAIRERIWSVDGEVPITSTASLTELVADSVAQQRYRARLAGSFALIAAAFAILGVYGVTSRSVASRRREIGVRVALGARQSSIAGMVVRQGLRLAAIGIACGCLGGLVAARVLASLLYDTSPLDPPTFVVVALALAACATIASMAPSLRAARVDPLIALRNE